MIVFAFTAYVVFLGAAPGQGETAASATPLEKAVERGLKFLADDAAKWRTDHECATCHHGAMTVWAFSEAVQRGIPIQAEQAAEMSSWTKTQFWKGIDQPRDPRPGWNLVKLPTIYLAVLAQQTPEQGVLSRDEVAQAAAHIARHQEADGFWSTPPPRNGPPPVFESPEVLTLWACAALDPRDPNPTVRESRENAARWLNKAPRGEDLQAALLRLLIDVRLEQPPDAIQPQIDKIFQRQQADGGWGQVKDLASDAFATGQALFILNQTGIKSDRPEIEWAVAFLVSHQNENGSWPMTSRAQPGEKPFTNPVPITYFGSAWATIGLLRCLPEQKQPGAPR
ncbi:MAG TPA: hypothetical protein VHC19_26835 [Pirellulales bacterium]|jgi:hypothetical protein|nr:hypothetical protein [Pirellulales bacterium]